MKPYYQDDCGHRTDTWPCNLPKGHDGGHAVLYFGTDNANRSHDTDDPIARAVMTSMDEPQERSQPPYEWDGIYRCEDHPAGTHSTIEEAEACIQGASQERLSMDVERLAFALHEHFDEPEGQTCWHDQDAERVARIYENAQEYGFERGDDSAEVPTRHPYRASLLSPARVLAMDAVKNYCGNFRRHVWIVVNISQVIQTGAEEVYACFRCGKPRKAR